MAKHGNRMARRFFHRDFSPDAGPGNTRTAALVKRLDTFRAFKRSVVMSDGVKRLRDTWGAARTASRAMNSFPLRSAGSRGAVRGV